MGCLFSKPSSSNTKKRPVSKEDTERDLKHTTEPDELDKLLEDLNRRLEGLKLTCSNLEQRKIRINPERQEKIRKAASTSLETTNQLLKLSGGNVKIEDPFTYEVSRSESDPGPLKRFSSESFDGECDYIPGQVPALTPQKDNTDKFKDTGQTPKVQDTRLRPDQEQAPVHLPIPGAIQQQPKVMKL